MSWGLTCTTTGLGIMTLRNIDPLAEKHHDNNPYMYANNNPVVFIDPDGMDFTAIGQYARELFRVFQSQMVNSGDHTIVKKSEDGSGTYTVTGGEADTDKGIYLDDGKGGKGKRIGQSITTHSFFDPNDKPVEGAIINIKSSAGQNFIDQLMEDNPSLLSYMTNATGGEKYDFKANNLENRGDLTELQYYYRGSVDSQGDIGSARDFGNIGAGLIAARKGYTWSSARLAFEALETAQNSNFGIIAGKPALLINPSIEGTNTVKAQMVGFARGVQRYRKK